MTSNRTYRNLRNRTFKNKNLSEADFSYCDLRGCDFRGAILTHSNFNGCLTGRSRRQIILGTIHSIAIICAVAVASVFTFIFTSFGASRVANAWNSLIAMAGIGLIALGGFLSVLVVVTVAQNTTLPLTFFSVLTASLAGGIIDVYRDGEIQLAVFMGILFLFALSMTIFCLLGLINYFHSEVGTNFSNADMTAADFSYASIFNTNFRRANLKQVNWTGAQFNLCFFPTSFGDTQIQKLCTSRKGQGNDYHYANLQNLNLRGVILTEANLAESNLKGADLSYADLRYSNLASSQAIATNFTGANLTGVSIQDWGINSTTIFEDIKCDYIYLELEQRERKPSSGDFVPGDFEKLVNQFSKTLDFLFRNGIEPHAFDEALKRLLLDYEDAGLALNSIKDVGDGDRLVQLSVANAAADKHAMHSQFMQDYESLKKELEVAREKIWEAQTDLKYTEGKLLVYREQSEFLQRLVYYQTSQFSRPSFYANNSNFSGDVVMQEGNKIEISNIKGDISGIAGGSNSGVSGKEIYGVVAGNANINLTNSLSQLEETKVQSRVELADLLKKVKAEIERTDSGLSLKDQQKAFQHLNAIAKLGIEPHDPNLLEQATNALDALPTIMKRGEGLIEFSEKYLPTFTAGIKTIFSALGTFL